MAAAPRTPPETRIYAIGDVHGRDDLLARLHRMIADDAAAHAPKRLIAVHLGDYVDRGLQSADVIDRLAGPVLPGFECIFLKGNHEELMLDYLDGDDGKTWFHNGGDATAESYGVTPREDDLWGEGDTDTRDALHQMLPDAHLRFLKTLELRVQFGDYLFVHAGIDPARRLDRQLPHDLLWIRDPFLDATGDFGALVVHGHTTSRGVDFQANRIGIDTGACYSGVLTALVLQDDAQSVLQTGLNV